MSLRHSINQYIIFSDLIDYFIDTKAQLSMQISESDHIQHYLNGCSEVHFTSVVRA